MSQTLPELRTHVGNAGTEQGAQAGEARNHSRWRNEFLSELAETAANDRWGRVLWAIAAIHLVTFMVSQGLYDPKVDSDPRLLAIWVIELLSSWVAFRLISGRWWYRAGTAAGLVFRVWVTFFILAFNSVMMNVQSGWAIHWYRLAWPTLGTFGFAAMAWLVDLRFLLLAVQMWLTGLVLVRFQHWSYLIYGVSWTLALTATGYVLERMRALQGEDPEKTALSH